MTIEEVCEMDGAKEIIEGIFAYTEKHLGRQKKLNVGAKIVGYTLDMMDRL